MSYENWSHEELVDRVEELEEAVAAIHKTEEDVAELQAFKTDAELRLEEAADFLAEHGAIINTPHAKRRWIEKGIR